MILHKGNPLYLQALLMLTNLIRKFLRFCGKNGMAFSVPDAKIFNFVPDTSHCKTHFSVFYSLKTKNV